MAEAVWTIGTYHPYVSDDHDDACAGLCTDEAGEGCDMQHHCWCPDGALSYADFQTKHPDVTVAEK